MTTKLSVSVPDDVAAFLAGQSNASKVVTAAMLRYMNDENVRRQARRDAADSLSAWLASGAAPPELADPMVVDELNLAGLPDGYEWK